MDNKLDILSKENPLVDQVVPPRLVCCWLLVVGGRVIKKLVLVMGNSKVRIAISMIRDETSLISPYFPSSIILT